MLFLLNVLAVPNSNLHALKFAYFPND